MLLIQDLPWQHIESEEETGTKKEKPKTTMNTKFKHPLVLLPKTENQMLNKGKTATTTDNKTKNPA